MWKQLPHTSCFVTGGLFVNHQNNRKIISCPCLTWKTTKLWNALILKRLNDPMISCCLWSLKLCWLQSNISVVDILTYFRVQKFVNLSIDYWQLNRQGLCSVNVSICCFPMYLDDRKLSNFPTVHGWSSLAAVFLCFHIVHLCIHPILAKASRQHL